MTSVRYHEAAEEELLEAIGYLELQVKGLGRRFLTEAQRAENLLEEFPDAGEEVRPGIRRRILRKFPSGLICSREGDGALILAVAHLSRRPEYWVGRA